MSASQGSAKPTSDSTSSANPEPLREIDYGDPQSIARGYAHEEGTRVGVLSREVLRQADEIERLRAALRTLVDQCVDDGDDETLAHCRTVLDG